VFLGARNMYGKVRGPECSAGPGAFSPYVQSFTPLIITVVARRSPKGIVRTGDGDRR
jgi:hypothetical protein